MRSLARPGPAHTAGQRRLGRNFMLQNIVARLSGREGFHALKKQDPQSLLIFDGVFLAAAGAQPEVFDGVPIRGLLLVRRNLVEAKQAPMPVIEITGAIGVSTFQIHQVFFRGLLQKLVRGRKSKIRAILVAVKLNNRIQRIETVFILGYPPSPSVAPPKSTGTKEGTGNKKQTASVIPPLL